MIFHKTDRQYDLCSNLESVVHNNMFSLVRWNVEWAVNNKDSEQQPRMWAATKHVINIKENEQQEES